MCTMHWVCHTAAMAACQCARQTSAQHSMAGEQSDMICKNKLDLTSRLRSRLVSPFTPPVVGSKVVPSTVSSRNSSAVLPTNTQQTLIHLLCDASDLPLQQHVSRDQLEASKVLYDCCICHDIEASALTHANQSHTRHLVCGQGSSLV